ncbi:extracellular solute-binding protein [Butyrivibrio sp. MC2013]|uniref:extracellular solute-binding protein n=1 Tax=Butyrivibrio sp. MC2013 TaxID=1280686 RepID=UPI00041091D6|nr:extracellular solute-binding protein [Butyrivibrio sp. MC2013]
MKKRRLFNIFVAGMVIMAMTGCSSNEAGGSKAAEAKGDVVEVRFTEWDGGDTLAVYEEIAENFNKTHPGIHVTIMNIPDEYDTKLTTMIAGNDTPEICMMNSDTLLFPLAEEGIVLNMQDYIAKDSDFDVSALGDQFKYMLNADYMAGYGIGSENICMFYNPGLFEEYGVEEPPAKYSDAWDWDTFVNTAQKLTIDKNGKNALDPDFDADNIDIYGVNIQKWWAGIMPFLYGEGMEYLTEDGQSIAYASEQGIDVLQKLADLTYVYHVAPTPTAGETMPGLSEALATNKVAMSFDGQWSNAGLMEDGVEYNVAALPRMGDTASTVATYGAISLMKTDKADEAFEFIKYLLTETGVCAPLQQSGLWLPTNMKEYDDAYMQSMITDKHPSNYYDAVVKPMIDGTAKTPVTVYVKNFSKINDVITPALDDLWSGEKTAAEVMGEIKDEADAQVQGFYGK